MKFRQDLLKFAAGLFIGLSVMELLSEGNISVTKLVGNAIGSIIGGLVYAWWINRKNRHEVFRKKE